MMTVHFYNYLAAVEVQPQSVATPTHKFTRARYSFDRCCTTSGTNVNRPGQILQIRDCPGDYGTVGAYEVYYIVWTIHVHVRVHVRRTNAYTRAV